MHSQAWICTLSYTCIHICIYTHFDTHTYTYMHAHTLLYILTGHTNGETIVFFPGLSPVAAHTVTMVYKC